MTCPTCRAQTRITDSRCRAPGVTYRRHRCKSGHVFSTLETVDRFIDRRICAATGERRYSLKWAVKHFEHSHKCSACGDWHLTPRDESATSAETT